jgi:prolyl-tRNA editing enzyme YbaK/EbsC (Cys-tRNA(Pro) deacylase)
LNDKLGKADANFVREHTGFVIGGVPPFGHKEQIKTFIDEDLFKYKEIWVAAGHPKAVFKLTPEELEQMTDV